MCYGTIRAFYITRPKERRTLSRQQNLPNTPYIRNKMLISLKPNIKFKLIKVYLVR